MGWIIGILAGIWVTSLLYVLMRPKDMESVIRRLPEDERRRPYRDFERIEHDEPTESDPEYGPARHPVGHVRWKGGGWPVAGELDPQLGSQRPATGQGGRRVPLQGW